jgi:hypothetical protein
MAASTRFLSAVTVAFVAGVASTSAYMSRGDARRDVSGAPHEATPSLAERGGSVCLNSELGLDEWISCRVQAATGCGSLSK